MRQLVLGSSSPYRRAQLATLGLHFDCARPDIDETPQPGEAPGDLARRLAIAKARAVAPAFPDALVIGSDQAAWCEGEWIGKPGTAAAAANQLRALRGKTARFYSAVALLDTATGQLQDAVVTTEVTYRWLEDAQIAAYLQRDEPYDCAGSFKSEALGIAILAAVHSSDPTALVGLPLITLTNLLAQAGVDVLSPAQPGKPAATP